MSAKSRPKIVVAEKVSKSAMSRLASAGEVLVLDKYDEDSLLKAVADADALLVRSYALINGPVIAAGRRGGRLRVIGRAGVGVDNIDVRAAVDAGIVVVHTPAACPGAVADLTVGLLLSLQRRIVYCDTRMREGEFSSLRSGPAPTVGLQLQTLGVIGMGRIGTAVGDRLHNGFGMEVIYYDIRQIGLLPFAAECKESAEAVYAEADVVTLHVPLTSLTRHMINADALKHFKKGSCLINTARGPVVEPAALAEALKDGRLAGAALDVHHDEPPPEDYPLFSAPNCVFTAHVGARTKEGLAAMNDVVDDVIGVLQGREPMYPADPDQF
ncbi:MAG: hydroxyacid dehydrogenase [Planctomycetota bacterium]|jgi:phosphoglycerate dehydrogenase-like enzyme